MAEDHWYIVAEYLWRSVGEYSWYILGECHWYIIGCSVTIERLSRQNGIVAPKVEDWRAMVDSIMIDTAYDGEVFNIVLADIPEKKTDLVSGKYKFPALEGQTTIAVKITDMLGEEILVTK